MPSLVGAKQSAEIHVMRWLISPIASPALTNPSTGDAMGEMVLEKGKNSTPSHRPYNNFRLGGVFDGVKDVWFIANAPVVYGETIEDDTSDRHGCRFIVGLEVFDSAFHPFRSFIFLPA